MRLRCLAPAKVNLCLFLGPTRAFDGRHELVTVYDSLSLCDVLELETLPDGSSDSVVCPGVEGENLAIRALEALRRAGWDGPPVRIEIEKRIPVAGGMAGGSADAAATLRLAMALAPGRPEEVETIAAALGADVPSQLAPGVAVGTGAGEVVERGEPMAQHAYVVVPSERELSTPEVFREADRLALPRSAEELEVVATRLWAALGSDAVVPPDLIVNDLAPAAISLCPSITSVLAEVRAVGAEQALVSGSGPTVIGVWWGPDAGERAHSAAERLREGHPRALAAEPVDSAYATPIIC